MKGIHLLKFKWLYNICTALDPKDWHFISSTLPSLQANAYGLNQHQIERLDSVYAKYKNKKEKNENSVHNDIHNPSSFSNFLVSE